MRLLFAISMVCLLSVPCWAEYDVLDPMEMSQIGGTQPVSTGYCTGEGEIEQCSGPDTSACDTRKTEGDCTSQSTHYGPVTFCDGWPNGTGSCYWMGYVTCFEWVGCKWDWMDKTCGSYFFVTGGHDNDICGWG